MSQLKTSVFLSFPPFLFLMSWRSLFPWFFAFLLISWSTSLMCFLSISFEICFVSFSKTNYPNHSNVVLLLGYLLQMAISKLPLPPPPTPHPRANWWICLFTFVMNCFCHIISYIPCPAFPCLTAPFLLCHLKILIEFFGLCSYLIFPTLLVN